MALVGDDGRLRCEKELIGIYMMDILFTYGDFYSGGSETLILRLALYYKRQGHNVMICCVDMIDPMRRVFDENGIGVFFDYYLVHLDPKSIIINFGLNEFVYFDVLRKKKYPTWINVLYVLHPFTLTEWSLWKGFIGRITSYSKKRYIKRMVDSGTVFFMDELCIRETMKYYNISFWIDDKEMILPVPYHFSGFDDKLLTDKIKKKSETFRLLTVARANFPFKGYIKGLIDSFADISKVHPNLRLTIVSYGKEIDKINEWIDGAGNTNICLIPGMDYKELVSKYEEANLYIGMGTTLLEAISKQCLVLPVEPYIYECKTWGDFKDKIDWLCTDFHKGVAIDSYLEEMLELSDLEYAKKVEDTWDKAQKFYDIDKVANRLLSVKSSNERSFDLYSFLMFLNIVIRQWMRAKRRKNASS